MTSAGDEGSTSGEGGYTDVTSSSNGAELFYRDGDIYYYIDEQGDFIITHEPDWTPIPNEQGGYWIVSEDTGDDTDSDTGDDPDSDAGNDTDSDTDDWDSICDRINNLPPEFRDIYDPLGECENNDDSGENNGDNPETDDEDTLDSDIDSDIDDEDTPDSDTDDEDTPDGDDDIF